jgi:hypothetical protein
MARKRIDEDTTAGLPARSARRERLRKAEDEARGDEFAVLVADLVALGRRLHLEKRAPLQIEDAQQELIEERRDVVTLTKVLLMSVNGPESPIRAVLWRALWGIELVPQSGQFFEKAAAFQPLHPETELASLLVGPDGKYQPISIKTGANGPEVTEFSVDPETGAFLRPCSVRDAVLLLKSFGESIKQPRFMDTDRRRGDRWLVRERRHHELYGAPDDGTNAPAVTTVRVVEDDVADARTTT